MEAWLSNLITALIAAGATGLGAFLLYKTQRRAVATQERQQSADHELGLTDKWKEWAEEQVEARRETEKSVKELKLEVEDLRFQFRRLEGRLMIAIEYLRRMLQWAAEVTHPTPHPPIPDDIADLINTKP